MYLTNTLTLSQSNSHYLCTIIEKEEIKDEFSKRAQNKKIPKASREVFTS